MEKNTKQDLKLLFNLLSMYEESLETLESKIKSMLDNFPIEAFELESYEVYQAHEEKLAWFQLSAFANANSNKKNHAVFKINNGDISVSVGYNKASNSISFSVNDGPLRFFNLGDKDTTSDKFILLMKKLLKLS